MDPVIYRQKIVALIQEGGEKEFFRIVKDIKKQRVNPNRDPRERIPWKDVVRQAKRQNYLCGICLQEGKVHPLEMRRGVLVKGLTVPDHVDPNRPDFNARDNWQAADKDCNAKKNSKSVPERSKQTGKTYTELVRS